MYLFTKLFTFIVLIAIGTTNISASEAISLFDQGQYSPAKYGLKDLVFEVRVDGMEEDLKRRFALDKIEEPRFKVYWLNPGRIEIEVLGLPPGFLNLKMELKKLIVERIEYVVPQNLSTRLRGYRFEQKGRKDNLISLKGKDETNSKAINEIDIILEADGKIRSMKMTSPSGSQLAKFSTSRKGWSHSKNVIDQINLVSVMGIQKNTTETTISYILKDGFGFPSVISTDTTIEAMTNTESANQVKTSAKLYFTNYVVNSGEAQKYLIGVDEKN